MVTTVAKSTVSNILSWLHHNRVQQQSYCLQAFDLGYQEIQLQVWGRDKKTMYAIGQDIAAIDSKVVVKVPMTGDGAAVAARLKQQKALVTSTAIYSSRQAVAAVALGADYLAPYLGRMNNAGRNVSPQSDNKRV